MTVTNGEIKSVNPSSYTASVAKIGDMQIVTVTAKNQFDTESMCTYMVNYVGKYNYDLIS